MPCSRARKARREVQHPVTFVLKFVGIFLLVAFSDFLWARYIKHTAESNALKSAVYASAIYLLGSVIVIAYIGDHSMVLPAVLGAFVGTYLSAKLEKK